MDTLPSSLQVPEPLGIDKRVLGSTAHPPLYPAMLTEVLSHNVKTILHLPALEPINRMEIEKCKQPTINVQVWQVNARLPVQYCSLPGYLVLDLSIHNTLMATYSLNLIINNFIFRSLGKHMNLPALIS